jgi:hypothetical protein
MDDRRSREPWKRVFTVCGLLLALAACATSEASAPDGIFLPKLDRSNDEWPTALIAGQLVEERGCVFLEVGGTGSANEKILLIWPHETTAARTEMGQLRISIGGEVVGDTGSEVKLGGGLIGERPGEIDQAQAMIGEAIPVRCLAKGYFLTSGVA